MLRFRGNGDGGRTAVADRRLRELEVVVERTPRRDPETLKDGMICLHGLDRADHAVDDQAEELDERELVLGVVDLAAEERDLGPIFLRVVQELEGVARRPRRAAEDADDEVRVVTDQLLKRLRAVIDDLQESRPPRRRRRPRASG